MISCFSIVVYTSIIGYWYSHCCRGRWVLGPLVTTRSHRQISIIEDAKCLCQIMDIIICIDQLKGHLMDTSRLLCQVVGTQTSIYFIQSSFNKVAMVNLFPIKNKIKTLNLLTVHLVNIEVDVKDFTTCQIENICISCNSWVIFKKRTGTITFRNYSVNFGGDWSR